MSDQSWVGRVAVLSSKPVMNSQHQTATLPEHANYAVVGEVIKNDCTEKQVQRVNTELLQSPD